MFDTKEPQSRYLSSLYTAMHQRPIDEIMPASAERRSGDVRAAALAAVQSPVRSRPAPAVRPASAPTPAIAAAPARPSTAPTATASKPSVSAEEIAAHVRAAHAYNAGKSGLSDGAQAALTDVACFFAGEAAGLGRDEVARRRARMLAHDGATLKIGAAAFYRNDAEIQAEFTSEGAFVGYVAGLASGHLRLSESNVPRAIATERKGFFTDADVAGWRGEFQKKPEIRAEFGDEETYVAFRRADARGLVKIFGR